MHRNLKKRLCDLLPVFLFENPSKSLISSLSTLNKAHKPDGINKNKGACLQTKKLKEILLFFYKLNKFRHFFSTNKVNAPLANLCKVVSARCINGRVSSRSDIGLAEKSHMITWSVTCLISFIYSNIWNIELQRNQFLKLSYVIIVAKRWQTICYLTW